MEREKRFKLIAAREAKGISQGQLADMLYIGQSGMSRIESGKNGITEKQAKILTEKLGIGADDLNELSLTGEFKSKTSAMKKELREIKERKRILEIDLQIAEILILVEKKGIPFDTFHRRLQYFEKLKNEREVV